MWLTDDAHASIAEVRGCGYCRPGLRRCQRVDRTRDPIDPGHNFVLTDRACNKKWDRLPAWTGLVSGARQTISR
jgi:hypothetical protein